MTKEHSHTNGHMGHFDFVEIKSTDERLHGPYPVILDVGSFIWIPASQDITAIPEVQLVTDGRSSGLDGDGNCIASVPAAWCSFISEAQAIDLAESLQRKEEPASA